MSDVMNAIAKLDVEEEIKFLDKEVRDLYCTNLRERVKGHFLSLIKGPLEVTEVGEKSVKVKGKIFDVAPAVIMGTMMNYPSSVAIVSTSDAMRKKYGYIAHGGEGEIIITDEIVRNLLGDDHLEKLGSEIRLPHSDIPVKLIRPSQERIDATFGTRGHIRKHLVGKTESIPHRPVISELSSWESGHLSSANVPDDIIDKYDRAVTIYNELNSNHLTGAERVPLLEEMQGLLSTGLFLYALKVHQQDVE